MATDRARICRRHRSGSLLRRALVAHSATCIAVAAFGLLWAAVALAEPDAAQPLSGTPVGACTQTSGGARSQEQLEPNQLTALIDQTLEEAWRDAGITPAETADDAEFLRRVYLDLIGRIPSVSEVRAFLEHSSPTADPAETSRRRIAVVEDLLDRAAYSAHMARVLREVILPGATVNPDTRGLVPPFETWLRLRLASGANWGELVREILTTTPPTAPAQPSDAVLPGPEAFAAINDQKPENLAGSSARAFLGLQVQCAQCHDHPFAKWKQSQFWSFAAFFGPNASDGSNSAARIQIPDGGPLVEAMFLDQSRPAWSAQLAPAVAVADWTTSSDNPFFARSAVNRMWELLFGAGLVEPVDDLDPANSPSHPELLDELGRQFTLHGHDFRYLVRAFTATRAYQLTSRGGASSNETQRSAAPHFAQMPMRRMTAEQLFDSLLEATGTREVRRDIDPFDPAGVESLRTQFMTRFASTTLRRADDRTSIPQALSMMNGSLITSATGRQTALSLGAVAAASFLSTDEQVETLYLATLSRRPTADENSQLVAHVEAQGETSAARHESLADVFWALLNSAEFAFNH